MQLVWSQAGYIANGMAMVLVSIVVDTAAIGNFLNIYKYPLFSNKLFTTVHGTYSVPFLCNIISHQSDLTWFNNM